MYCVKCAALGQKLYFRFCRVHVHVHSLHGKIDLQHADREAPNHELVFIRLLQSGGEHPGFYEPGVDKEILIRAVAARTGGLGHEAAHRELLPRALDLDHVVRDLTAKDGVDGGHAVAGACGRELLLPIL